MHIMELEGLLDKLGRVAGAVEAPGRDIAEVLVVAKGFAVFGSILLAEVAAAGFVAVQRIDAHKLSELEEIGHTTGFLQTLVKVAGAAEHFHVAPILFAQLADLTDGALEAAGGARHAAVIPHKLA